MPQTKAPAPHNFANIAHSGPDLEGVVLDILHLVCLALIISDLLKYHCEEASQHPILLGGSVQLMPALEVSRRLQKLVSETAEFLLQSAHQESDYYRSKESEIC